MASKLKGITIEIGGNTGPLTKALEGVNGTARKLKSELYHIEQLLKLDPSNVTLLKQKHELLAKSIENTSKKLDALKEAEKQVQKQFENGDVGEEQYRELQREIIATEQKLGKFEEQASDVQDTLLDMGETDIGLLDLKRDAAKAGDSLNDLEKDVDDLDDGFTTAKGTIASFAGNVLADMVGQLGDTIDATKDYRVQLAKLETNAETAGASVEETKDVLERLSGVSQDTEANIEGVSNLLAAGYTGDGLTEAVDALSGAVIQFPDTLKIESLADGLQETLATGSATGSFAEMLERVGINLDDFNAGLQNCKTEAEKQQYALDVLATTGLADVNAAYRENNENLVNSAESQYELNDAMAEIAEIVEPIQTFAAGAFADLLQWIANNGMLVAGIITAIGIALLMFNMSSIITKLTSSFQAFNVALKANPIMAIASLVVLLIGYLVNLYNTNEDFRNKVNEIWGSIKEFFQGIGDWFTELFEVKIPGIFNTFSEFFTNIFSKDWSEQFGFLGDILNGFFANIQNIIDSIKSVFDGIVKFVKSVFTGDWEGAWEGVKQIFKGIFDTFLSIAKAPINGVIGLINGLIGGINWIIEKVNTLQFEIPDWKIFGDYAGQTFGFNFSKIAKIAYLAQGGVVSSMTPAILGEAGTEAIVPLEKNTGWLDVMATMLVSKLAQLFSGGSNFAFAGIASSAGYYNNQTSSSSMTLHIENFNNYRSQSTKEFMEEAEFYRKQAEKGVGK